VSRFSLRVFGDRRVIVDVCGVRVTPLLPLFWAVAREVTLLAAVEALAIGSSVLPLVIHLRYVPLGASLVASVIVVVVAPLVVWGA
jgi:hypothetical protein